MAPTVHAAPARKIWFNKLWLLEKDDTSFMAFTPTANPMRGEDGDDEVMQDTIAAETLAAARLATSSVASEELEDEVVDDGLDATTILEEETRNAVADLLNTHENQVESRIAPPKVIPIVEYWRAYDIQMHSCVTT